MIKYYAREFLQYLGYRKVWYFPSRHMPLADFYKYEYRPDLPKGIYNADYLKIENNIHD